MGRRIEIERTNGIRETEKEKGRGTKKGRRRETEVGRGAAEDRDGATEAGRSGKEATGRGEVAR